MTFPENYIFPFFPGFPDPVGTLKEGNYDLLYAVFSVFGSETLLMISFKNVWAKWHYIAKNKTIITLHDVYTWKGRVIDHRFLM